jgi:hypothetical protein
MIYADDILIWDKSEVIGEGIKHMAVKLGRTRTRNQH